MKNSAPSRTSPLLAAAFIGLLFTLGGCSTPVTHEAMVPVSVPMINHHQKSVAVVAEGGMETSAAGAPMISNEALRQAVVDAINGTKTFSSVVNGKNGDYLLNVNIFNLAQPMFGMAFTVKMEMGWTLKRVDTGAVVWQEMIKSEHTATVSDAFVGATRLKMATEGAARNNVAAGLGKLSALSL
jgi:hypothetical protein